MHLHRRKYLSMKEDTCCSISAVYMCSWSTDAVISSRCICSNSQQYSVWVKIIDFYYMPKIIRTLRSCSMKIFGKFPTVNISKHNFWLVICIAKNFIWTTLKMIFSIYFNFFLHPQIPDFQIVVSQPNIFLSYQTIHQCKAYLFSCIDLNFEKLALMTGFVVQGHI